MVGFGDGGDQWVSNLDLIWWVYNLEIGVDFVNKEDADLLIVVGVCWVQISGYAYLFLGLIVGVC